MLCAAVAFHIYDLNDSGVIEKDEVQRLLIALLQDNPAIDLTDGEIEQIVEQARAPVACGYLDCHMHVLLPPFPCITAACIGCCCTKYCMQHCGQLRRYKRTELG